MEIPAFHQYSGIDFPLVQQQHLFNNFARTHPSPDWNKSRRWCFNYSLQPI